jgi:ABC-type phosphate transport system substrate-binding protein
MSLVVLLNAPASAQRSAAFQVVVNANNPVTEIKQDVLSNYFLKKITRWDDGTTIHPTDLPAGSAVREAFSHAVHGKSVASVAAYWQQQIFSGRGVPPPEKGNDAEVAAFVRADPGAIGYLSAGPTPPGLKTVQVTP